MRGPRLAIPLLLLTALIPGVAPRAAVSLYLSHEDVAAAATLAVEGTISRVASGYDPETRALSTYVTLDVTFVHRGPRDLDRIVIREAGGRLGDLVHEVDAVPTYEPGERVFVFLEPGRDGALRTAGTFFGKYVVAEGRTRGSDRAVRDLSGQGTILRRPAEEEAEEVPLRHLAALAARVPPVRPERRGDARAWSAFPPEMSRLRWDCVPEEGCGGTSAPSSPGRVAGSASLAGTPIRTNAALFAPLSSSAPARWAESDSGTAVSVQIEPARNPLNDGAAAVAEMKRAMAAWTNVPEGRLVLQPGSESYNFTGSNPQSPAAAYPPVNVILFGDPYNDVSDPSGCSGTLAIGGYWRSGSAGKTVNNVTFYPELRLYVIFNNGFECFLGNADNLAEVATHELGHGIGLGHSSVADAVMRSTAYGGGRGPRLGEDDRDAAHCHYPHTLAVTSPNGGESWAAGSLRSVTWTCTSEAGPDPGTVRIEYSADGGGTWTSVASAEANDGSYAWTVPDTPGTRMRVRVTRPNRVSPTPSPYPSACSQDASDADFTIAAASAGTSPDGSAGTPLRLTKASGSDLTLTWGASCSAGATDYAVYEGTVASLRAGSYDHAPKTCSAGTDLTQTVAAGSGSRYYLVAPLAGSSEGRLGKNSSGADRPASTSACASREASSCP